MPKNLKIFCRNKITYSHSIIYICFHSYFLIIIIFLFYFLIILRCFLSTISYSAFFIKNWSKIFFINNWRFIYIQSSRYILFYFFDFYLSLNKYFQKKMYSFYVFSCNFILYKYYIYKKIHRKSTKLRF